jgi:hypothetical protein
MIGGWGYRIAPPPFAVSRPADSARARAPPWPRGRKSSGSERRHRASGGAASPGEPRVQPEVNYGQESRYVLPYISPRSAQEVSVQ